MVDIISNGRLDVTLGLGYMPAEFEMFGVPLKQRGELMDAKLQALRHAFDGAAFDYDGRKVQVTPSPVPSGGPGVYIGGGVQASARRAAQFGDGFYPMEHRTDLLEAYVRSCVDCGKSPGRIFNGNGSTIVHIAEDPEAAWAELAPYALHETNSYAVERTSANVLRPLPRGLTTAWMAAMSVVSNPPFFKQSITCGRHSPA